jgi:hypothetical protein
MLTECVNNGKRGEKNCLFVERIFRVHDGDFLPEKKWDDPHALDESVCWAPRCRWSTMAQTVNLVLFPAMFRLRRNRRARFAFVLSDKH